MDRTEKELSDKLQKAGYSEETIARTMEYVRYFGYIDDRRYAEKYIDAAKTKKSRMRIIFDLTNKGVDRQIIDEALDAAWEGDERELVRSMARKKLKNMDPADPKTYAKAAAYLARKGFSSPDILAVLGEIRNDPETDPE